MDYHSGNIQGNMLESAVIICNGAFPRKDYPRYLIDSADIVVCCDGALVTLEKHGITPDVVIGDMDSVCRRALARFDGKKVRIDEQETNDLTKAFNYLMENHPGVNSIHIIAASGKNEAHTIANYSLLMEYESRFKLFEKGVTLDMVSDYSTAFAISDSASIHIGKGRRISIFSPDTTLKITSEGLEWQTSAVTFDNWWKASLNIASTDEVKLAFNHPSKVLIILD